MAYKQKIYRFKPILKQTIWGGDRIIPFKGLDDKTDCVGESWELSGVKGNESIVSEGECAGIPLDRLIELKGAALIGKKNFERFGSEFPLLIKFIDAKQDLSIQVHPDDSLAKTRHNSKGKTEMWYVINAEKGASLRSGFCNKVTPEEYAASVADNTITDILCRYEVHPGDVFFLPAGRIHSIGAGSFIAEIQQTSDITYRIYDFNRRDAKGNTRELHTELAKDAIDFEVSDDYRTHYKAKDNEGIILADCDYFTTKLYHATQPIEINTSEMDSFLIVIIMEGGGRITADSDSTDFKCGETLLISAETELLKVEPSGRDARFLITYVE